MPTDAIVVNIDLTKHLRHFELELVFIDMAALSSISLADGETLSVLLGSFRDLGKGDT